MKLARAMMGEEPFSNRYGHRPRAELFYDDVPTAFRNALPALAKSELSLGVGEIEDVARRVLGTGPAVGWDEIEPERGVSQLLEYCDWYAVLDVVEALYSYSVRHWPDNLWSKNFEAAINEECHRFGLGYEMHDGRFEIRLSNPSQGSLDTAVKSLRTANRRTAANELGEAMQDLSRRPRPDRTGAVQHVGAAIECLAREICGNATLTLGEIIKRYPDLFPGTYRKLAESIWGISSNHGRHVEEGGEPTLSEAILLVETVTALVNYLLAEAKPR